MSERHPRPFYERDSSDSRDWLRQNQLKARVRAYFAGLDLHERYALLTAHPFRGLVPTSFTEDKEPKPIRRPKAPEYPGREAGDDADGKAFASRVKYFHRANRRYRQWITDYCDECLVLFDQEIEKFTSRGEYFDKPRRSTLQIAEARMASLTVPQFAAWLFPARDWTALLPPTPLPTPPAGCQTSLF